ncbi:hypothetical protein KP79_PYT06548 [Mizuhopecten yessoensis]|uniref:Uncharacterized protein n=1 Tax=Mizuhopecten yessoensis TaxID=6573 RepID=A0A210Q358_MIZYE|nr:hypothetical protein KP79_PYT06548 [Mizuhopecten yessoensis]
MSRAPVSRQANRLDFLAGSERLLRVHHKNSVFSRDLQHCLDKLDITCRKNISKFQQTIFDVYHNEFVPIREEANALRLPKLPLTVMNVTAADRTRTVTHKSYHDRLVTGQSREAHKRSSSYTLPRIKNGTIRTNAPLSVPCYTRSPVNIAPLEYSLKQILERPPTQRQYVGTIWKKELDKTTILNNDSDIEDSSSVNSKTLQTIKNAIALTSQPSKPRISSNEKILRKSFLLRLRRTSKSVCHSEMLQQVDGAEQQSRNDLINKTPSESVLREAKLAKLLMLRSTSNIGDTSVSLDSTVALTADVMPKDGGRQSSHSAYVDRFRVREKTFGSDLSSDDGTCTESPTYFSEISEEPSFLSSTASESDTSSSYSYSDSYGE